MSQSRELQLHINQLEEIRSILNAMKNQALVEIHKLAPLQIMQGQVVANIENAALDFLDFYPGLTTLDNNTRHICVLVGAERGFCGDFNKSLINAIATTAYSGIIAIGNRLCNKLVDNTLDVIAEINGANSVEEIPTVLNRLIETISRLEDFRGNFSHSVNNKTTESIQLTVVYHDNTVNQINQRQLFPPFAQKNQRSSHYHYPPILNLETSDFFADLIDHYLFAVLHEIFYFSLMAENLRRLQHLEGAVKHLDDETVNLRRKSQIYRQEEITEEIEVILLNTENT
ncbi:MAG: F0F1 ATP synthase subunit gamma [Methylococcaceae bacterium]